MTETLTVHVYCGNYTAAAVSMFEEPPECSAEADLSVHPDEIDFATYTCPGCGATNAVRDHEVTDHRKDTP